MPQWIIDIRFNRKCICVCLCVCVCACVFVPPKAQRSESVNTMPLLISSVALIDSNSLQRNYTISLTYFLSFFLPVFLFLSFFFFLSFFLFLSFFWVYASLNFLGFFDHFSVCLHTLTDWILRAETRLLLCRSQSWCFCSITKVKGHL